MLHLLQHVFDVHKPTEKEGAINSVEKSPNIPVIFLNVSLQAFSMVLHIFYLSK